MSSPRSRISRLLPLLGLLLAGACTTPGAIPPPVADLQAVVESKPVPGDDIATSQTAADQFSASIEGWADRISAAGGRLCRWSVRTYKVKIGCPTAPAAAKP